jgi:hypothetical protein
MQSNFIVNKEQNNMGFFSKTCAKTHLPIITDMKGIPRLSEVVALLPDGRKFEGSYDGYGRVGGESLVENPDGGYLWDKVKLVLKDWYEGEDYKQLGKSGDELAQGYFMDKAFLHYCLLHGPFKNRSEYTRAFKKYANW